MPLTGKRELSTVAALFALTAFWSEQMSFAADAYFNEGLKRYKKGDYRGACPYFEQAARRSPSDSNAFYFAAVCWQQIGDNTHARERYLDIVCLFPGSEASRKAADAMKALGPPGQLSPGSSNLAESGQPVKKTPSPDGSAVSSARPSRHYSIPFVKEGNDLLVEVEVNGSPCKMYFNAGAKQIAFSRQDLAALNIAIPESAVESKSSPDGSAAKTWCFPIKRLKLGPLERSNIEIAVSDERKTLRPLLGQSFYSGWHYTIDIKNGTINFVER